MQGSASQQLAPRALAIRIEKGRPAYIGWSLQVLIHGRTGSKKDLAKSGDRRTNETHKTERNSLIPCVHQGLLPLTVATPIDEPAGRAVLLHEQHSS